jgi:hypothetical protein
MPPVAVWRRNRPRSAIVVRSESFEMFIGQVVQGRGSTQRQRQDQTRRAHQVRVIENRRDLVRGFRYEVTLLGGVMAATS